MADLAMFQNQKSTGTLVFAPAPLDAGVIPAWVATDPLATFTLVVAADGLSALVTGTGVLSGPTPGSILVTATLLSGTVLTASAVVTITAAPPPESMTITWSVPA